MPIYEYRCKSCGAVTETIQRVSEKPLKKCKQCSGALEKLISRSSFHLKGSGWYLTDYARKGKGGSDSGDSSSSSSKDSSAASSSSSSTSDGKKSSTKAASAASP